MTTPPAAATLIIETERLILRPMRMDDVEDLLEYQSQPDIVRYIPWPERTREQVVEAAEKLLATGKLDIKEEGDFLVLVWEIKAGEFKGKVIGQSNLGLESSRDSCADIGWVTHQDFQRQGYAFEATHALMDYAFKNLPIRRLIANIDTRNPESAAMATKLGMRREGEFIDAEMFKGALCSMWLYAILKHEFTAH
jgi:aminoglycoside 6'-N-acetyltransferase